jgi:hypothetical protein
MHWCQPQQQLMQQQQGRCQRQRGCHLRLVPLNHPQCHQAQVALALHPPLTGSLAQLLHRRHRGVAHSRQQLACQQHEQGKDLPVERAVTCAPSVMTLSVVKAQCSPVDTCGCSLTGCVWCICFPRCCLQPVYAWHGGRHAILLWCAFTYRRSLLPSDSRLPCMPCLPLRA